jgi:CTP:molybdopterin cytidylyltransferase MocA
MGEHKALLKFDGTTTFIAKIMETYLNSGIDQLIVVVNAELSSMLKERKADLDKRITIVVNENPELGRFYSLQTGVNHMNAGNFCFLQNIDNPFVSKQLLNAMFEQKERTDVIIPAFRGKAGHPVLFGPMVAKAISASADTDVRIDAFLRQFKVEMVETADATILKNINKPGEYIEAGFKF